VDAEIVGGGTHGARDEVRVPLGDLLELYPHVLRKFHPATTTQSIPHRLVEIASGALALLRQRPDLIFREMHVSFDCRMQQRQV